MNRVLVLSPEPVRRRMAGMGIRALRIAEHLGRAGHDVVLASPAPEEVPLHGAGRVVVSETREALRRAEEFQVAVVSGHTGKDLVASRFPGAVVADLYDPFLVENLSYTASLGPNVFVNDRKALFGLLERADFVLAATEEQRLFWLGLLLGLGRLSPADIERDAEARRLCDLVPFGVDETPPSGIWPFHEIPAGEADVLFGGVYDWYDAELVLDAWPAVLAKVPSARLLFSETPNRSSTPQVRFDEAKARAEREGWLGRSVIVLPWASLEARGGLYGACRVAAVAQRPSLETALSFRTRLFDFLWAGLPVVTTEGGAGARLIAETGAGRVVPADPPAFAAALVAFLSDGAAQATAAGKALEAAAAFHWERTLSPLLHFAAAPWRKDSRASGIFRRLLGGVG
ncbi:MAG: glycosyltransferase [Thermoanaerobaculia bacterium]